VPERFGDDRFQFVVPAGSQAMPSCSARH